MKLNIFLGKFCIIHYDNKSSYSKIKEVNDVNEQRIRQAKSVYLQSGNNSRHLEQCGLIPDVIDDNLHGIHIDPCYKIFTRILSDIKEDEEDEQPTLKINTRLSTGSSTNIETAWLFPDECHICKKVRVQHKGKKVTPVTIQTTEAVNSITAAALAKNYEMYLEIKDVCLFAKEFKTHAHCYKEFTRGFTKSEREASVSENLVSPILYKLFSNNSDKKNYRNYLFLLFNLQLLFKECEIRFLLPKVILVEN